MKVLRTKLPGVLLLEPETFEDPRGWFLETYSAGRYAEAGIEGPFVQDNVSFSGHGVLRGLHLQWPRPQGKLIYVLQGEVFDVAVDVRQGSPTFGQWDGHRLSGENRRQIWIPAGFAHGFLVTAANALVAYKCSDAYDRECELAVRWDDPDLGIRWPVDDPSLSDKDVRAPRLKEIDPARLPPYSGP